MAEELFHGPAREQVSRGSDPAAAEDAAQGAHGLVEGTVGDHHVVPYGVEDGLAPHGLLAVVQEQHQQVEVARDQRHGLAAPQQPALARGHREIGESVAPPRNLGESHDAHHRPGRDTISGESSAPTNLQSTRRGHAMTERSAPDAASDATTVIGRGIHIRGELTGSAPIEVWGSLEGVTGTEGLFWVREGGKVGGEIAASQVIIEGHVDGKISAEKKVEFRPTCRVQGDVVANKVAIAEGAFFEGRIRMSPEKGGPRPGGQRPGGPEQGSGSKK